MDKKMLIQATNIKVSFADRVIWENANFEVEKGEYVAILGPNGAGKTTLIKLLLGLIKTESGKLNIFNETPQKGNSRIGYVPQRRPIDRDINIEAIELVKLGINGNKWGWENLLESSKVEVLALDALKQVDAEKLAFQPLGVLSGGELQRVFLAQALVGKPDLLLLDEPLANLDIKHERNLVNLISKIVKSTGISVLLIAHDLNPLLPVLDKVIYVANGHISSGTPDEIINSKTLSQLYATPIEVLKDSKGRVAILGIEEAPHHHA